VLRYCPEWENQPRILEAGEWLIASSTGRASWQGIPRELFTAAGQESGSVREAIRDFLKQNLSPGEFETLTVTMIQRGQS